MNLRIRNNNLAWLPVRTSLYIENQKELIQSGAFLASNGGETSSSSEGSSGANKDGLDAQSAAVVGALREEIKGLGKQISAVSERITDLEDTVNDSSNRFG